MVSMYSAGSSAAGEELASEVRSGGSVGLRPVAVIEAENPWGSWGIALRVSIIPGDLVYPGFGGGSLKQASAEHVIQGPVAPLVDGIAFRVIRRGENLLYSKQAQELGPYGTDELAAAIGELPVWSPEIWNNMPHEGLADCVGGVVAGWDEDGILRVAVYEDDQELVAVIWR